MKKVVIFGTGGPAVLAYHQLTMDPDYTVEGFTVDADFASDDSLKGLPLVPFGQVVATFSPDDYQMLVAVGYLRMNGVRAEKFTAAKEMGYSFVTYIHPRAIVYPEVTIGENCIIGANTVIQHGLTIGDNVVIRDGCHVGHESRVEDHCFICSHTNISGGVTVEPYCLLGAGSIVKEKLTVAQGSLIGAGVALLESSKEREVYMNRSAQKLPFLSDRISL